MDHTAAVFEAARPGDKPSTSNAQTTTESFGETNAMEVGPSACPSLTVVEEPMVAFGKFVRETERTKTVMDGGRYPRPAISLVADMVRRNRIELPVVESQLMKVGIDVLEADGFVRAVERVLHGRELALLSARDLVLRPDPVFLVDGLLVEGSLALLVGKPATAKTFLALSLAMAIATGAPWLDRGVEQGAVVYVAAEGVGGIPKRLRALQDHLGLEELPEDLYFIEHTVDLLDHTTVRELVGLIEDEGVKPALVVIDTYARSMPGGDENSAKDTGLVVKAIDDLRFSLGTAVLALHHTTKKGDAERGSGALLGAADTAIGVEESGDGYVLKMNKQKDFEADRPFRVRLVPVGDSAVIAPGRPMTAPDEQGGGANARSIQELVMDALRQADEENLAPISQTALLKGVKGNMSTKIDVLHAMAEDDTWPVVMEGNGNRKMYSLRG